MYAAIGYGGLTAIKAVGRIRDDLTKATRRRQRRSRWNLNKGTPAVNASGVIVEDIGSCMIKFSRCCTPVPGDDIIGFITKGYGVSVHRKDCPNARARAGPRAVRPLGQGYLGGGPGRDVLHRAGGRFRRPRRIDAGCCNNPHVFASAHKRNECPLVGGGTAIVCLRFGVHNLTELEKCHGKTARHLGRA